MSEHKPRGRPRKKLNRDRIKSAWADVHPGLPPHDRLDIVLGRLIDAMCDELEGNNGDQS
jgi:hypothetical protein